MPYFDLFLLISGLILASLAVFLFVSSILKNNSDASALALTEDEDSSVEAPLIRLSKPLVLNLTLHHAHRLKFPLYRKKVKTKIIYSGLAKQLSVDEFIGIQILWGLMFPAFAWVMNFALQMGYPVLAFPAISVFGIYFPHFYLQNLAGQRQLSVERDLPFFIDLMALSTEAGLDFVSAIQKISEKAEKGSVLAEEFETVLKEIKLGSTRKDALQKLSQRIKSAELKSFVTMVCDSDETGASIAHTLKAKSEQMRYERFNKAEQLGAKASQKILIPMMIFIIPAVLITVFAPIALQFFYGGKG